MPLYDTETCRVTDALMALLAADFAFPHPTQAQPDAVHVAKVLQREDRAALLWQATR